jgi:hypothetical protein
VPLARLYEPEDINHLAPVAITAATGALLGRSRAISLPAYVSIS